MFSGSLLTKIIIDYSRSEKMLDEKIELLLEYYLRPYKKNKAYHEQRNNMEKELGRIAIELKNKGRVENEVYEDIVRRLESGEIKANIENLSFDNSSTLRYTKKLFSNESLQDLEFINAEYNLCDFKGSTIENKDIKYTAFKKCYFKGFNIIQSTLYQSNFKKSDFTKSFFNKCEVSNSLFYGSHFPNVSFTNSKLLNTSFEQCYIKKATFKNSALINVQFNSCTLSKLNFSGVIMDKITYRFLKEENVVLSGVEVI